MKIVKVFSPEGAARFIARQLADSGVTGDPFGRRAIAALNRTGQIAASVRVGSAPGENQAGGVVAAVAVRGIEKISPTGPVLDLDLLFDRYSNMVAMRGEVTIEQMRQFVEETGYKAAGHNADDFTRLLGGGKASNPMVFTNEADCLTFIKWAWPKAQAQDPRIETLGLPSKGEWGSLLGRYGAQIDGKYWERLLDNSFRSFRGGDRSDYRNPEARYSTNSFRLVGTYKRGVAHDR
jgi:hypothetical protein